MELPNQKGFAQTLLVTVMIITIAGIGGALYFYTQGKQNNAQTTELPIPTNAPSPSLSPSQHIYENKKYNFKFYYPENYQNVDQKVVYSLDDRDSTIILTKNLEHLSIKTPNEIQKTVFTIYDIKNETKDNLINWWKDNVKTESITAGYNANFPGDYIAKPGLYFEGCVKKTDKLWVTPISINVNPTDKFTDGLIANDPGVYQFGESNYIYYDFGIPFVLHFNTPGSTYCLDKEVYQIITTITKI